MKKRVVSSIFLFLTTHMFSIANAQIESELGMGVQYRIDNLDWNIAGGPNGESPNVLSELQWRDIKSYQVTYTAKVNLDRGFYFTADIARGFIFEGKNQDSDWALDDRNAEFSRSNNNASDGDTSDFSFGLGWTLNFGQPNSAKNFRLAPLIGMSKHRQLFTMTDGVQTVSDLENLQILDPGATGVPPLGPFDGLDSTYEAQWKGYWLGLDTTYFFTNTQQLNLNVRYHRADYEGEGNWNLRSDFQHPVSFIHETDAQGIAFTLGWTMHLNKAGVCTSIINISSGLVTQDWIGCFSVTILMQRPDLTKSIGTVVLLVFILLITSIKKSNPTNIGVRAKGSRTLNLSLNSD